MIAFILSLFEIFETLEVVTGNNAISDQLDLILESLKSLEIMKILDTLQLEILVSDVFKDWNLIRDYFEEHLQLKASDIEEIRKAKLSVQKVSSIYF
jgi:hypothetical protein